MKAWGLRKRLVLGSQEIIGGHGEGKFMDKRGVAGGEGLQRWEGSFPEVLLLKEERE